MDEGFEIPVIYKGAQFHFPARLVQSGYTYRFEVMIKDNEIWFERDEEGRYRALVNAEQLRKIKIDIGLLQTTAEAIESLV
jgi:hypothetical protein